MAKAKKIVLVFLSILTIFTLVFALPVSAAGTTYNIPFTQPLASDSAGYVELLLSNGDVFVCTFQSTGIKPDSAYVDISPSSVTFKLNRANAIDGQLLSVVYSQLGTNSYYEVNSTVGGQSSLSITPFTTPSNISIVSVKAYGFIRVYTTGGVTNHNSFQIIYGADVVVSNQINALISIITNQNTQITDNADKNASNIQSNADKNASETQANDDKNTQAIIDNQNDLAEKEKNETQNQGEGSVNDVSGAIEDKSSGFISSIHNLVSAMSYNGTACAWKVPSIKLPAISGIMDEVKLTDEMPIDFAYWVNKIPANILLLVRSLLTIGLIGYCFKELYNTISYVLTLKGGGNDE